MRVRREISTYEQDIPTKDRAHYLPNLGSAGSLPSSKVGCGRLSFSGSIHKRDPVPRRYRLSCVDTLLDLAQCSFARMSGRCTKPGIAPHVGSSLPVSPFFESRK
jgi:hypothetical protein